MLKRLLNRVIRIESDVQETRIELERARERSGADLARLEAQQRENERRVRIVEADIARYRTHLSGGPQ